jgi:hypothetical protein
VKRWAAERERIKECDYLCAYINTVHPSSSRRDSTLNEGQTHKVRQENARVRVRVRVGLGSGLGLGLGLELGLGLGLGLGLALGLELVFRVMVG